MEDKTTNIVHEDSMTGFLRLLYKNIIWIVIITILCASLAIGYSMLTVKPTYTANRSVILRMAVGKEDTELDTVTRNPNTATNNATLAKIYLYDVAETITSPVMIEKANLTFGEENVKGKGSIKASNVSVKYGEDSLIFSISYKSDNKDVAIEKLETLIGTVAEELDKYVEAKKVTLIDVQNVAEVTVSSPFTRNVVLGILIGLVLGVGLVFIKYALDNTVHDKEQFENMTGISVIAYIDKK